MVRTFGAPILGMVSEYLSAWGLALYLPLSITANVSVCQALFVEQESLRHVEFVLTPYNVRLPCCCCCC